MCYVYPWHFPAIGRLDVSFIMEKDFPLFHPKSWLDVFAWYQVGKFLIWSPCFLFLKAFLFVQQDESKRQEVSIIRTVPYSRWLKLNCHSLELSDSSVSNYSGVEVIIVFFSCLLMTVWLSIVLIACVMKDLLVFSIYTAYIPNYYLGLLLCWRSYNCSGHSFTSRNYNTQKLQVTELNNIVCWYESLCKCIWNEFDIL